MATIKDVAEKAGVSIGTVDRIIHNRGRFSTETAARVQAAIRELDYKVDMRARNLSLSQKCRIGVLMPYPQQDSYYWQLPFKGMQKALTELKESHVTARFFHYNRYHRASLEAAADKMKKESFEAYVAAPLIRDFFWENFNQIFQKKPAVFFDTDITHSQRYSYIGQNSLEAGHLAAKLINLLVIQPGHKILIVTPMSENEHLRDRIRGFTERVNAAYETLMIPSQPGPAQKQYEILRKKLVRNLNGIYVTDSSSHHLARIIAGEEMGKSIALIGYDLIPDNIDYLRQGVIDFILTQRPIEQGYNSIHKLYKKVMLGQDEASDQFMPIDIITQENLAGYINAFGID